MSATKTQKKLYRRKAELLALSMDRGMLLWVLDTKLPDFHDKDERNAAIAACRRALVSRFPCHDCGSLAGAECKPEYGCKDSSRW